MRKIFFIAFAIIFYAASSILFIGCKDDGSDGFSTGNISEIDWDKIMSLPYSSLTPDEQKLKLEKECIDFIDTLDDLTSLKSIETLQYLTDLFEQDDPDLYIGKSVNKTKEVFEISNVYGIFTWNSSRREWSKTSSSSELKFIFPATKKASSNNATLSLNAVNSGITVTDKWEYYDYDTGKYTTYEEVYHLPKSVDAILTIDNKEAAKITVTADYNNNNEIPVKQETTISSEGYTYWYKIERGNTNKVSMKISHNNKTLIEALLKSDIKIDDIIDNDFDYEYDYSLLKEADAFIRILDNLMLVYRVDLAKYVKEMDKIEDDHWNKMDALWSGNWYNNPNYYSLIGQYEKEYYDKSAKAFNDYMKVALVSNTENYKIADVIVKSEKDGEYWDYYYWNGTYWDWDYSNGYNKMYDYYWTNPYLKFNDKTEVELFLYFSEGFNKLEKSFEDFINSFNW
ncbi:MAG: hypothetical protein FWH18_06610 [Marinilabiliaceae bacterium]|nr:hypothetical protein [Marinilabiliaceae bacterium]